MSAEPHKVAPDPRAGFHRLDPLPSADETEQFYESQYYHLLKQGGRAPNLRRLLEGGEQGERELRWLQHTQYTDVLDVLGRVAPGRRILEVGCGTGHFVAWAREAGFDATGIEPSETAVDVARERGLDLVHGDLATYIERDFPNATGPFDAAIFLNVFEHVPDPHTLLEQTKQVLSSGGIVVMVVPNDFSAIQALAQEKTGSAAWWIAAPDHVNYFDFDTAARFLRCHGLSVVEQLADFPMEMFLLMGDDYTRNPELGGQCHARRVAFDMALPPAFRQRFYRALASQGVGRNLMVFGRLDLEGSDRSLTAAFRQDLGPYTYVALRRDDIHTLRDYRNAQMDVLRQKQPLTPDDQERWFDEVVTPTHASARPGFLLVSILDGDGTFLGYGGLTNIDWDHGRAELSFLVDPERAADAATYEADLTAFVRFVRHWAFERLGLQRIFSETYAFREAHIAMLESAGMRREGTLVGHTRDADGAPIDSIMHGAVRETG